MNLLATVGLLLVVITGLWAIFNKEHLVWKISRTKPLGVLFWLGWVTCVVFVVLQVVQWAGRRG